MVSPHEHTLPMAPRRPGTIKTNDTQTVVLAQLMHKIVLAYKNRGYFCDTASLSLHLSTALHFARPFALMMAWGGGVHIAGRPQIASDVSPLGGPYR